jgi:hypothetical protein
VHYPAGMLICLLLDYHSAHCSRGHCQLSWCGLNPAERA